MEQASEEWTQVLAEEDRRLGNGKPSRGQSLLWGAQQTEAQLKRGGELS